MLYYTILAICAAGINVLFSFKYNMSKLRAGLYAVTFVYGILGALLAGRLYLLFCVKIGAALPVSSVAMFGALIFTPVLDILTVEIEKLVRKLINKKKGENNQIRYVSTRNTIDMIATDVFFVLGFAKLNCNFDKCCYGIPSSFGVYSPYLKTTVLPVQIGEAACIFIIICACCFLKEKKFFRRGMAYPLTAAMYSVVRFGFEFLRYYSNQLRHAVLGMTVWQVACIVVFVVSIVSLVCLYKTQPSEPLVSLKEHLASAKSSKSKKRIKGKTAASKSNVKKPKGRR